MSFHRSIWVGALGAFVALAATSTAANASVSAYGVYHTWANVPIQEFTTITNPSCGAQSAGSSTATTCLNAPLKISNNNSLGPVQLFRDPIATNWTTFWPHDLVNNGPYSGDVWGTNNVGTNGAPVTSITLKLSSPQTTFGFDALPEDIRDSAFTFTVNVTLKDASNHTVGAAGGYTETMHDNFSGGVDHFKTAEGGSCTLGGSATMSGQGGNASAGDGNCGFFGFRPGVGTLSPFSIISISITAQNSNGPCTIGNPGCATGGLGVGDFVDPIPEPSSLALLGGGLIGLGLIRRRLLRS